MSRTNFPMGRGQLTIFALSPGGKKRCGPGGPEFTGLQSDPRKKVGTPANPALPRVPPEGDGGREVAGGRGSRHAPGKPAAGRRAAPLQAGPEGEGRSTSTPHLCPRWARRMPGSEGRRQGRAAKPSTAKPPTPHRTTPGHAGAAGGGRDKGRAGGTPQGRKATGRAPPAPPRRNERGPKPPGAGPPTPGQSPAGGADPRERSDRGGPQGQAGAAGANDDGPPRGLKKPRRKAGPPQRLGRARTATGRPGVPGAGAPGSPRRANRAARLGPGRGGRGSRTAARGGGESPRPIGPLWALPSGGRGPDAWACTSRALAQHGPVRGTE